jgi:hypothetical protein
MMNALLVIAGLCLTALVSGCGPERAATEAVKLDGPTMVEAACGQCQLGLEGKKGCDLAIRHEGTSYFVDGFKMADLGGDAHAADGLCTVVRRARVTGQIANGRFAATMFELLPAEKP